MDEIFDGSMDGDGMSSILSIMENVLSKENVFVISHKGDQLYDKFHSNIKFVKHNNFSKIAM
jgi:molecular chaperone GrpE (heat shock protein)